jgi:NADH:ubiquinone oxidoreductase subunit C
MKGTSMNVEKCLKGMKPKTENGNLWVEAKPAGLIPILKRLKSLGMTRISSITGIDTGKSIEVIYHFIYKKKTVNIRVSIGKKACAIESITSVYPGANLFERELYEMLGVNIKNHPNLKKLFLSEESPQTPLRKS